MMQRALRQPRSMIMAGMGTGKSGAIMGIATCLEARIGRWPGLFITAPLQVALNWRKEAPLWRPGKRVAVIAGTEAERKAAVKSDSDIYILTYDNADWLHKYHGGDWSSFGAMWAADEASRLKSTRAIWNPDTNTVRPTGGPRTSALAVHSAQFSQYVSATGTPIPNGLTDIWGQAWHIDGGARLCSSYDRFLQRWFDVPNRWSTFDKPKPKDWALAEITGLLADVTTVIRTEDYFNVAKPNVVDRWVEMPKKARDVYNGIHKEMIAELESGQIVSVDSGSSRSVKLLQIAGGGFIYYKNEIDPEANQVEFLHDVKLDALDSILEETGENLVVVYFFKAQLAQLKARYKDKLRTLDDRGVAQDEWNQGKIKLLAVQYTSASMGISLQHGGRNIALLCPTHRQEDAEQIIERIGPMRQMQSGYNRVVNVFRIMVRGSTEMSVYRNTEAKGTMQELTKRLIAESNSLV